MQIELFHYRKDNFFFPINQTTTFYRQKTFNVYRELKYNKNIYTSISKSNENGIK